MATDTQLLIAAFGIMLPIIGSVLFVARWLDGKISDLNTTQTAAKDDLESTVTASIKQLDDKQSAANESLRSDLTESILRLDEKQDALASKMTEENRRLEDKLSGEIKEVRQASADAHKEILDQLCEIRVEQGKHSERLKSIEHGLDLTRTDDDD